MSRTLLTLDIGDWCQSRFTHIVAFAYQGYIENYEVESLYEYIEQELLDALTEDEKTVTDTEVLNDIAGILEEERDVEIDKAELQENLELYASNAISGGDQEELHRRFLKLRQSIIGGFQKNIDNVEHIVTSLRKNGFTVPVIVHADDNRVIFSLKTDQNF